MKIIVLIWTYKLTSTDTYKKQSKTDEYHRDKKSTPNVVENFEVKNVTFWRDSIFTFWRDKGSRFGRDVGLASAKLAQRTDMEET